MDSIVIGFSKPKTFKIFAWFIMKGLNIPYDHIYIKFHSDSYDRDLLYQASGLAVNFMSTDIFNSINDTVKEFTIPISTINKQKMVQFCIDQCGKPYGIKDICGLAWVRLCELVGKKVNNPVNSDQSTWICSELGAYILEEYAGKNIPEDLSNITPKDLFDYLSKISV